VPGRSHWLAFLLVFLPSSAWGVDGISVTGHWSGENKNLYGGYGAIVRHDIVNSQVVGHTTIYETSTESLKARNPVISPDGTRVAFLRQDGTICVVSINGGAPTCLSSAQSHGEACLDWPAGDWIYYTKGGFSQPSGSKLLHRVNATTGTDEYVLTFKKDDGATDSGTWRFHIANDLRRAAVRPDDTNPHPAGCITAFDLVSDGHLRSDRSIGSVGDYRCSTGMDPGGTYFLEGNQAHDGVVIHRWDDLSPQKTILWANAQSWGPDTWNTGTSHNRNAWSANSEKWFCIHIGFGTRGVRGANQMLINWVDEERIVVTENADNSYQFDCAGDFWVGSSTPQAPQFTQHPQDQTVLAGEEAVFTVQASGSPPPALQWQRDGSDLGGQNSPTLRFAAGPADDGARFRCAASNSAGSATSNEALLTVLSDATPPTITSVTAPGDPNTVWVVFSEALETTGAQAAANYSVNNGISVGAAVQQADPAAVKLTTSALSTGVTYTLTVNNVTDQADPPNRIADDSTFDFTYEDQNLAPVVDAGPDQSARVGEDLFLDGSVTDDGLPGGALAVSWSKVSGPGNVVFSPPDDAQTYASFEAQGDYVVRLTADDGDKNASDDAAITVMPPPSITITRPAGGESFTAGDTEQIQWTTVGVDDVRMGFSADSGQTWMTVAETVDTQSPDWGDYPWPVPNIPTDQAMIQLTVYSDPFNATVSNQFTIAGSGDPQVTLTAPTGGEALDGNTVFDICFDAQDLDMVVLEVTLDGQAWDPIATVGVGDPEWGQFPWTVPNVSTTLARIRVRAPGGTPADTSGAFSIVPEAVEAGPLEVTWLKFSGKLPSSCGAASVQVAGNTFSVADDKTFEAEVEVPAGAARLTFEIQAGDPETEYRRVVEVELKNAVPGLGVSVDEIKSFLDGKSGVLVWVDAGGGLQSLDFRGAAPEVKPLGDQTDCVNPIISPDGTRVVYSQGPANGPKTIFIKSLSGGDPQRIAVGDIGYWNFSGAEENVVYCDWSDKDQNGAGGKTYLQKLVAGTTDLDGDPVEFCDRAMDAGPNADISWLGQVYGNLWAYNAATSTEYPTGKFFLQDATPADHQTCNGSLAPDQTARLMCLVIPHDFIRIFTYDSQSDTFTETSRFTLPSGMAEWEFPEWSTHPDYFTAVLRAPDLKNRLFLARVSTGETVPDLLELTDEGGAVSYSHLYVEP
jgi:hypothetical protein